MDVKFRDLQIGTLLSLLQDDAKNQASYLTWNDGLEQPEVAAALRRDFLVSEERAEKLSGPWAHHAILGRMYLPSYRAGTDAVADWRREHAPEVILPALYGCRGLVDDPNVNAETEVLQKHGLDLHHILNRYHVFLGAAAETPAKEAP